MRIKKDIDKSLSNKEEWVSNHFLSIEEVSEEILQQLQDGDLLKYIQSKVYNLTDVWTDAEFMKDCIPAENELQDFLSIENLHRCKSVIVDGFVVIENIDGGKDPNTEIKLVITNKAERQHIHIFPDSYFIFVDGYGEVLSGPNRIPVWPWDHFQVPRFTLHGFKEPLQNSSIK